MKRQKEFKTNDFYSAVILRTMGFPLIRLERSSGKFVVFVFADSKNQAEELITKYWNHEIKVDARELIDNIRELKTRIHSGV